MTPSPQSSGSLPPLPDLQSAAGTGGAPSGGDGMASVISGIAPVKNGVDMAMQGIKMIAQSGAVPGVEQILGPMIQQLNQILVMTAQQAMQPQGSGQQQPGPAPQGPFSMGAPPPGGGPGGGGPQ